MLLQAGWVASLVFHFPSRPALGEDATPSLQRLALSFGVLSVVFFTKAHLTHERFVERASQQLRRHLVFVVGLCAACLALTGTILLLLDPTERFRPRNDVSGDDASGGDTSQARSDYWPVHSSLHMLIKSAPALSGPWHAGPLHYSVALSFFLAAGMSAYGAAGYILHGADNSLGGWNFFQPFKVRLSLHVQVELVGCTSTPPVSLTSPSVRLIAIEHWNRLRTMFPSLYTLKYAHVAYSNVTLMMHVLVV